VVKAETLTARTIAGLPVTKIAKRDPFLNILIYGESGVGKTTLAGSSDDVPMMRPVLFIDMEGGTESLRSTYPDVEFIRVTTWQEMQGVYSELASGKTGINTVVLDSLTEIQKFNMYNIMTDLIVARPDLDPDVPGMREWGKNLEQMRRYVRNFRDLPMNTIFTALARVDKDQKTGLTTIRPSLSGKMAEEVAAFLDIVAYYYIKQVGSDQEAEFLRLLLTRKTDQHVAKDRTGTLPFVVREPNMKDLHAFINTTNQIKEKQAS
jgi:hypothetical protein